MNDIEIPESDEILLVSSDGKKFRVHSAILNARYACMYILIDLHDFNYCSV